MISTRNPQCAPEQHRGSLAAQPIPRVGPLRVVEAQVGVQGLLELPAAPPAELDAPVLLQERALKALDEAVRPGVARLGARVPDPEGAAGLGEGPRELAPAIGEPPLERPAGLPGQGHQARAEERRARRGGQGGQDLGHAVRARGITGRHRPDLPHALQLPPVEGVEAHELPRVSGPDVVLATAGGIRTRVSTYQDQ